MFNNVDDFVKLYDMMTSLDDVFVTTIDVSNLLLVRSMLKGK